MTLHFDSRASDVLPVDTKHCNSTSDWIRTLDTQILEMMLLLMAISGFLFSRDCLSSTSASPCETRDRPGTDQRPGTMDRAGTDQDQRQTRDRAGTDQGKTRTRYRPGTEKGHIVKQRQTSDQEQTRGRPGKDQEPVIDQRRPGTRERAGAEQRKTRERTEPGADQERV